MTWKELYGLSLRKGPAATQELLRLCLAAVESSPRPALRAALGDVRILGLYALCDGLDAHGELAPNDGPELHMR